MVTRESETKQEFEEKVREISNFIIVEGKEIKSPAEIIIFSELKKAIEKINTSIEFEEEYFNQIYHILLNSDERQILKYLKNGITIILKDGRKQTIKIIDYENLEKNFFILAKEVVFLAKEKEIKPDYVVFVNGIPLVAIEVENKEKGSWEKGFSQLINYYRDSPHVFRFVQYGLVIADNIYYFPFDFEFENSPTEKLIKKLNILFPEDRNEDWEKVLEATIKVFVNKNVLNFLKYYTFYYKNEDKKFVARWYQYYTVEDAVKTFVNKERRSGLIWHYQGSGKSYVIILFSYIVFKKYREKLKDPTILIVVDREELERQIRDKFGELELDLDVSIKNISLYDIPNIYSQPAKQGIYTILIQQFRGVIKSIEKDNIAILIDEAHRSHYGILNQNLLQTFPNAFYIGLTGTPRIFDKERDTLEKFGENLGIIYFLDYAIKDGYVLEIYYKPMYDIFVLDYIKKEKLLTEEELWEIYDKVLSNEGYEIKDEVEEVEIKDIEEDVWRKIGNLRRLVLENEKRIEKISKVIYDFFKTNVEPKKLKGLVVVESKKAAFIYYNKLIEAGFKEDEVDVVVTYDLTHSVEEKEFFEKLRKKHKMEIRDPVELNKLIEKKFREEKNPKLVIVVYKMITGFDMKEIYVIFIDKLMSGYTALQTIGRCNRIYDKLKEYGIVVDFIGIYKRLKETLELYFAAKKEPKELIKDPENLIDRVNNLLEKINERYFKEIGIDITKEEILEEILTKEDKKLEAKQRMLEFDKSKIREFEKDVSSFARLIFSPLFLEVAQKNNLNYLFLFKVYTLLKDFLSYFSERDKIREINELESFSTIIAKEVLNEINKKISLAFLEKEPIELKKLFEKPEIKVSEIYDIVNNNRDSDLRKFVMPSILYELEKRNPIYKPLIDKIIEKLKSYNKTKSENLAILDLLKELREIERKEEERGIEYVIIENSIKEHSKNKNIKIEEELILKISEKIKKKIKEEEGKNTFAVNVRKYIFDILLENLRRYFSYDEIEKIANDIIEKLSEKYKSLKFSWK